MPLINSYIKILSIYLIKIDDNMVPIRDKNGFCIECKRGEKGLLIGMIGNTAKVINSNLEWFLFKKMYFKTSFFKTSYNGYANNSKESNKKIIEDVFKKGQRAFNSGTFFSDLCP